jgi:hypothetical protein
LTAVVRRNAIPRLSPSSWLAWIDAACALGGALAAILALDRAFGPVARAIRVRAGGHERLEPYIGFTLVVAAALVGVAGALGLRVALARFGEARFALLAPLIVLSVVALLGVPHALWLVWAAPGFVIVASPLVVTGRVRPVPWRDHQRTLALVCIASEAASLGVGGWLPYATPLPALLLPAMLVPAAVAAHLAAFHASDGVRWRVVLAGMPSLLLPFVGLERNPTLRPTILAMTAGIAVLAVLRRRPAAAERAEAWAGRHAPAFALPALLLVLVLPWHFRDLGMADLAGHEGQHLGWINSMTFGKMMMADAGFTYGPAREYILAALAWSMGGLTLEHIRLAHVVVNMVGLGCVFAAMRRVCAGQVHALLLGLGLIVTHSAIASFVVYTKSYSIGWADACRAGLATLAVVVALTRPRGDARRGHRHLVGAGALAGLSVLYSHDFGIPAVIATLVGLASETFVRSESQPVRARARGALRSMAFYGAALAVVLASFVLVYAARGKARALLHGYQWTMQVSSGRVDFPGRSWKYGDSFDSLGALRRSVDKDDTYVAARALDYVLGPGLVLFGLAHAVAALVLRRFVQRTTVILGLAVMGAALMHHAFLAADPWHMADASTPGLVLLVALGVGGRRLVVRWPGGRPVALGVGAAALLPVLWLANGSARPINMRLARIASGEERPSTGPRYDYPDLPRVGDLGIGSEHLDPVRFIRAHSRPDDPVFCTTWMLGGGTEAFLSERRNPTSFDKPDEVVADPQREQRRAELQKEPPLLIVGGFFDYLGT